LRVAYSVALYAYAIRNPQFTMKPIIGITAERWSSSTTTPNHNVHGALASYLDAVSGAGGLPVIIPLTLSGDDLREVYARLDGILIPGGGDVEPTLFDASQHPKTSDIDPERDRVELDFTRRAAADRKPLFGICRGVQVFNVALGGTLVQDIPDELETDLRHAYPSREFPGNHHAHSVKIEEETLLARILGVPIVTVNSRHHQSVKDVAPGLEIVARAPDGVIEAVELPDHPFALGVQWHPENLQAQPEMKALFVKFVEEAAKRER